MRREFLKQLAAMGSAVAAPSLLAQGRYPDRPIRIIVGFAPGGSFDPIIRLVQPKMAELLGQPVIVDNRPGASTAIACDAVARSPADGHTLLFTSVGGHAILAVDRPQVAFDPIKDFTPVATIAVSDWAFSVSPSLPVKNLAEYIAYCKANPGKVSFGSSGTGLINHLAMERFNIMAGIRTVHVPYKAAGTALVDLSTGRIQAYFSAAASQLPLIRQGRLRGIAYTASNPADVPPEFRFAAVGMPDMDETVTQEAVFGPAGMAPPLAALLAATFEKVLALPDVQSGFRQQSTTPLFRTGPQTLERLVYDHDRYVKVIREAGINMGAS